MQGCLNLDVRGVGAVACLWVTRPLCPGPDRLAATPLGREDNRRRQAPLSRVSSPWRNVTISTMLQSTVSDR